MAKKTKHTFVVWIKDHEVSVVAERMEVNHRGDLVFCNNSGSYQDATAVACFRTGSWTRAEISVAKQESEP
jgi:hypothetical protein